MRDHESSLETLFSFVNMEQRKKVCSFLCVYGAYIYGSILAKCLAISSDCFGAAFALLS